MRLSSIMNCGPTYVSSMLYFFTKQFFGETRSKRWTGQLLLQLIFSGLTKCDREQWFLMKCFEDQTGLLCFDIRAIKGIILQKSKQKYFSAFWIPKRDRLFFELHQCCKRWKGKYTKEADSFHRSNIPAQVDELWTD